jgi:hypothetical protein
LSTSYNFGGGRCLKSLQHPQGALHRRLQLRWWSLPKIQPAHPRGAPLTSSTSVVATAGPTGSTPQGARHRRPATLVVAAAGNPASTPGVPPSMSATSVVVAVRNPANTPQGARHRRLHLRWWPLLDLPPASPRGSPSTQHPATKWKSFLDF